MGQEITDYLKAQVAFADAQIARLRPSVIEALSKGEGDISEAQGALDSIHGFMARRDIHNEILNGLAAGYITK